MIDNRSYLDRGSLSSENEHAASPDAGMDEPEPLPLSPAHLKMLRDDSAISEDTIRKRGYRTINDSSELHQHAFGQAQCRLGSGLFIPTYDVRGEPHSAQFRADNPRSSRDGKVIKYETPKDSTMYLDVLPGNAKLLSDPGVMLWITEGLKKADALSSLGLVVIALFGVWTWRGRNEYGGVASLADWDEIALKGRKVIIAFDNDYREKASVLLAMHRLAAFLRRRGAIVSFINLPEGDKLGIDDYLAQGHTIDDVLQLKTETLPEIEKQTQAEALVAIAESRLELIYTREGQRLATATYADGHREVYTIGERGSSLRDWLIMEYRGEHKRLPSPSALSQAMEVIGAECRRYGKHVDIFTRFAAHDGRIYLDMGTPSWEAIEIDRDGWRVVKRPPVYFRRPPGMRPLPTPVEGGSLDDIAKLLHLGPSSNESMLIQGWLIGTLHPRGPYTHLNLQGEQGSGKTTATKMLRCIVDPNISPTRRQPKEEEDLVLAAMNGHIVGIENVSGLPLWLSDTLCGLSTGIGLSRRKKYTDDDETLFNAQRPAIINGITPVATRGDLIDRLICVELPDIGKEKRRLEADIWQPFHEKHPAILGALLDAVSRAMKRQDEVVLTELPRMADFAHWVEAAAPALGWEPGAFLKVYKEQKEDAIEVEIEASPVALALLDYLQAHQKIEAASASDILICLEPYHTKEGTRRPTKSWPEKPEGLGHALKRIAPAMRQRGYIVEKVPGSRRDGRKWQVIPISVIPISDGDGSGDGSESNRHHEAKPSPEPSPNNPLNGQHLGEKASHGDGGDGLYPHSSVGMSEKREKDVREPPCIDRGGNKPSPPSPPSPDPFGNTQFDSAVPPDTPPLPGLSPSPLITANSEPDPMPPGADGQDTPPPPEVSDPSHALDPHAPTRVNGKYRYRI